MEENLQREFNTPQEICPYCGSGDISNEDAPHDGILEVQCFDCGGVWSEPSED